MSGNKTLFALFGVSVAINSYGAFKQSEPPWPGTIVRIGAAFGILGVVALADEAIAELLAAGFVLASILSIATAQAPGPNGKWNKAFGATAPPPGANFPWYTLSWNNTPAAPQTGTARDTASAQITPNTPGPGRTLSV